MTDTRHLPLAALNERRLLAVKLRIDGLTLKEVRARTGLSAPTIIAACRAWRVGGWPAVPARPRGRATGEGRTLPEEQESEVLRHLVAGPPDRLDLPFLLWQMGALQALVARDYGVVMPDRTAAHYLQRWTLSAPKPAERLGAAPASVRRWYNANYPALRARTRSEDGALHWIDETSVKLPGAAGYRGLLRAVTNRGKVRWMAYDGGLRAPHLIEFFDRLIRESNRKVFLMLEGMQWQRAAIFTAWLQDRADDIHAYHLPDSAGLASAASTLARQARPTPATTRKNGPDRFSLKHSFADRLPENRLYIPKKRRSGQEVTMTLSHLQRLEAESIHAMREVVAVADNPVMLYSIGKDSAVMLHLAMKAFYPAKPPFPLLHVDTTWKFREMYAFRDQIAAKLGLKLLVHINLEGLKMNISPFVHGSAFHTDIMKTQGLKQALDKYGFDAAFGGARRDEEKSRAKERIFSFRSAQHRWDPKNQRPELWHLYNARKNKGESMRVFPLSNWTELDIWQYIYLEDIPIVPLYFAKTRPVVERDGTLIMVDDERMPLNDGEVPMMRKVRFRTLGCYPLTGAVESDADTLPAIIQEMLLARTSERQGRVIDHDSAASMEKKKQEGYF